MNTGKLISDQTAHDEAIIYLHHHDGDALNAIREVVDNHFYQKHDEIRVIIIDQILHIKGL